MAASTLRCSDSYLGARYRHLLPSKRWNFRCWWICRQIEHRNALVITERSRHVRPIMNMPHSLQGLNAMLYRFVILVPGHRRRMGSAETDACANFKLDLGTEESFGQARFY